MNRTSFLVDGFNVYHSARSASQDLGGVSTKWLDLKSLLSSFLPVIGAGAILAEFYYFSAIATHLGRYKPGVPLRHRVYLDALMATEVIPVMDNTDLAPAVRTALGLFPSRQVCFAFPYKRKNKELTQLVLQSFLIRKERYPQYQFPAQMKSQSGRLIRKPGNW